eukprot:symbB.v1.2.034121.t1/scaffold4352.1/size42298/2
MMSHHKVPPDVVSFNATASACEKRSQWSWALWVFAELQRRLPAHKRGPLLNISNACISACAKALRWQEALLLGAQLVEQPDKVTYNGLLGACKDARGQHWGMILQLLVDMKRRQVLPAVDAWSAAAEASLEAGRCDIARPMMDRLDASSRLELATVSSQRGGTKRWLGKVGETSQAGVSAFQALRSKLNGLSYVQPFSEESFALVERLLEDLLKSAESYRVLQRAVAKREKQTQEVPTDGWAKKALHDEQPQLLRENVELHRQLLHNSEEMSSKRSAWKQKHDVAMRDLKRLMAHLSHD